MAPKKMNCKNNESFQYSGKEMSPLGLGYCADAENLGKEMVGKDGNLWVVRAPKGIKLWARVTEEEKKLVREPPMLFPSDNDASDVEDPFGWKPAQQEEVVEQTPSPLVKEVKVPDAPKKRGRPSKAKAQENSDAEDKPKKERKPRAKKNVEGEEKKERKPRAKTEYNMYISEKLKELREKHKDLKTTEYFKMAIAEWKVYKDNKNTVEVL